jgi:hypothetical protein
VEEEDGHEKADWGMVSFHTRIQKLTCSPVGVAGCVMVVLGEKDKVQGCTKAMGGDCMQRHTISNCHGPCA